MKILNIVQAPVFVMPKKEDFNYHDFTKKLLEVLGLTLQKLRDNHIETPRELFDINTTDKFVIIDNGKSGVRRNEYLKLSYGKSYLSSDMFTSYGDKITLKSKIHELSEHCETVIKNKNATVSWKDKMKNILPENGFFRFVSASVSEHEGTINTAIKLDVNYSLVNKFDINLDNIMIKINETNGYKNYEFDYTVIFDKSFGRKDSIDKVQNFSKGLTEVEVIFSEVILKIKSIK